MSTFSDSCVPAKQKRMVARAMVTPPDRIGVGRTGPPPPVSLHSSRTQPKRAMRNL
jgi:hypothetical protein